jgi:hypothetical protein
MTPKRPRDPNQLAKSIIDIATGEKPDMARTRLRCGADSLAAPRAGKVRAANLKGPPRGHRSEGR